MNVQDVKEKYYLELQALEVQLQKLTDQKLELMKSQEQNAHASKSFELEIETVKVMYQTAYNKYKNYRNYFDYVQSVFDVIYKLNMQDNEAARKDAEEITKIVEVARRVSVNGIVPECDEDKLKDYSLELYLVSKNMALAHQSKEQEKFESLWD